MVNCKMAIFGFTGNEERPNVKVVMNLTEYEVLFLIDLMHNKRRSKSMAKYLMDLYVGSTDDGKKILKNTLGIDYDIEKAKKRIGGFESKLGKLR